MAKDALSPLAVARKALGTITSLPRQIVQARRYVRMTPFPTDSEEGRAAERYRIAALTTATSFLSRGLGAAVSLVSVPLTIGYLGKQQYGLWMALNSLLTWAALADFGLARGLQNQLSEAHGKEDRIGAAQAMSTAFFALLGLALIFATAFAPLLILVPWGLLLKISEPALLAELVPTLAAVIGVFLAQFPLNVVGQAYAAYQRGHVANLFGIVGSVLSLGVLLLVIRLRLGLPWLILASGGFSLVMTLVNLIYLLCDLPFLRPRWSLVSMRRMGDLVRVSTPMLLFQLSSLLINEMQILIIARTSGVSAVTDYSIFQRVFSLPVFVVAMIDGPYVPMFREAHTRGDTRWFRDAFFGLQRTKLILTVLATGFYLLFGNLIARLLSGHSVSFSWQVWVAAGILLIVGCWNGSYNHLFFAIERLWSLVFVTFANGLVTFPLTYYLGKSYGILGIVVATTAFSLLVSSWMLPVLSLDIFRKPAQPTPNPNPEEIQ
ncbi:MAG: lipopolysaccharide biosynthesis protein [Myxococcales bacterium]|nr:lipopolysaccharide biosynthesis protein [Polyangiaceae bacterium]MDW8251700.1 lipopolysaccharide biosynthesis protein [Myxococcales bacterium]